MRVTTIVLGGLLLPALSAFGQSFNIDLGTAAGVPSDDYPGAGLPGFWNAVSGTEPDAIALMDLHGEATDAVFRGYRSLTGCSEADHQETEAQVAFLLDDFAFPAACAVNAFMIEELRDGPYEVVTYGWLPFNGESYVGVTLGTAHDICGSTSKGLGARWRGGLVEGATHVWHTVEVVGGVLSICYGGGIAWTGTINGVQLIEGAPPRIVHGVLESFEEHAFSGYIDPRMESDDGADLNLGLDEFTLVFSEEVRDLGSGNGGRLTAGAFSVTQTGLGAPPNIKGIEEFIETDGRHHVTILLDRIIALQEWTTIRAEVEDLDGVPIPNLGDLGPGLDEPDRIDVGLLPGDVDQNGQVTPRDLIWLRQMLSEIREPDKGIAGDYIDIDRDGVWPEPQDVLRFRQLILGTTPCFPPGVCGWAGEQMNSPRP